MTKRRIRVLVADDHAPTRTDVARTLGADPRFIVCAEVSDAVAAVDAALRERPDICLLDIRMPGGGILATREILARLPDTKIVMLTVSDDDRDLFWALRAGASGYLLKTINPERLPAALADVAAGEPALPRVLVARLMETFRDSNALRRQLAGGDERSEHLLDEERVPLGQGVNCFQKLGSDRAIRTEHCLQHGIHIGPAQASD